MAFILNKFIEESHGSFSFAKRKACLILSKGHLLNVEI